MHAFKLSLMMTLAWVATGHADDTAKAAKAAFHEQLYIDDVKKHCGLELTVTSDFEKIDLAAWGVEARGGVVPEQRLGEIANGCQKAIDAVTLLCRAKGEDWKTAIARDLKGVQCQFTGHSPKRASEDKDVWIRRNLTFASGVLGVRMAPAMGDLGNNAVLLLKASLGGKPGAPAAGKSLATGARGEQCTRSDACQTGLCLKGVCAWCNASAKCPAGLTCDGRGSCRTPEDLQAAEDEDRSTPARTEAPSPKKDAGKALGKSCKATSECRSGLTCKAVSKTRSTCR